MVTLSAPGSDGMLTIHPADSRHRANTKARWRFGICFLRIIRKLSLLSHEDMRLLVTYRLLRVIILSGKPNFGQCREAAGGQFFLFNYRGFLSGKLPVGSDSIGSI